MLSALPPRTTDRNLVVGAGTASFHMSQSSARIPTPVAVAWIAVLTSGSLAAYPQEPRPEAAEAASAAVSAGPDAASSGSLQGLITALVRENLPDQYESRDHWGDTKEIWAGVNVRLDGLQIKTKRRKKEVNHGTWKLYQVRFVEPEKHLHVDVQNIRESANGRVEFDLVADARLDVFARLAHWELGVQLISLSVNADARTQIRVRCNLGLKLDPAKFPPDVVLDPVVTEAELRLAGFRVRRISQIGGSIARELGEEARDLLDKELAKQNQKLPSKINRQIDKNRQKLRLSVHDVLASQWRGLAAKQLGLDDNPTTDTATTEN